MPILVTENKEYPGMHLSEYFHLLNFNVPPPPAEKQIAGYKPDSIFLKFKLQKCKLSNVRAVNVPCHA